MSRVLLAGKFCFHFIVFYITACTPAAYVTEIDIDANFATDIIPRGWKVRQARQTRISVPDAKISECVCFCVSSAVSVEREFETSNAWQHGGFLAPRGDRSGRSNR